MKRVLYVVLNILHVVLLFHYFHYVQFAVSCRKLILEIMGFKPHLLLCFCSRACLLVSDIDMCFWLGLSLIFCPIQKHNFCVIDIIDMY